MTQFTFVLSFIICINLLISQPSAIECRPRTQRIVIHGHEWTVPNEAGWENVLNEAELVRQRLLSNCASSRECRLAAEQLRQVFLKHPVSAKHYDESVNTGLPRSEATSIFKWG